MAHKICISIDPEQDAFLESYYRIMNYRSKSELIRKIIDMYMEQEARNQNYMQ